MKHLLITCTIALLSTTSFSHERADGKEVVERPKSKVSALQLEAGSRIDRDMSVHERSGGVDGGTGPK